jgi:hypothetical protein
VFAHNFRQYFASYGGKHNTGCEVLNGTLDAWPRGAKDGHDSPDDGGDGWDECIAKNG